jgi:uncharacterized SAM-binding protein YcdF (DUF218 family)
VLGVLFLILDLGHILDKTDTLAPADAIVVLGGDGNYHRMRQAAELWKQSYAPLVAFSLPPAELELLGTPERTTCEVAAKLGLAPNAEVFAGGATSTYEEAQLLGDMVKQRLWHRLIIVTDSYHTRRAAQTFRAVLPGATIMVVAAPSPTYDVGRWWNNKEGLTGVMNEVVKLGFYCFKYGISPL